MKTLLSTMVRIGSMCAALSLAHPTTADTLLIGSHSVTGQLCVGTSCTGDEDYNTETRLKLIDTKGVGLMFVDLGSDAIGGPEVSRYPDWALIANPDLTHGFALRDHSTGNLVARIGEGARASALTVAGDNNVGFGTMLPQRHLHVVDGDAPTLRLEQDDSGIWGAQVWDLKANETAMQFHDITGATTPLFVETGTPSYALNLTGNGRVGLGLAVPQAAVHLQRNDGSSRLLIEETASTSSPRTLLSLQNNGRPEIVMGNTNTGGEWSFGAGTNFILKQGAVGTDP